MARPTLAVLGVMTGTSCDGLDAACISISKEGWSPLWSAARPYPAQLRKEVLEFQRPKSRVSAQEWLDLHRRLGEWYGRELKTIISKNGTPDVIANHGQTIAHFPAKGRRGITLQMGEPTRIAHATGITVVSNFRDGDMAAGGQGAPLTPLFHRLLAQGIGNIPGISIHNIGGISNLTYIGPNDFLLAFDTGPGNIWIDAATERATGGKNKFDKDGKLAFAGEIDWPAIERILKHPYFSKPAPKSTGRDDFPLTHFFKSTRAKGADLVATATALTVESIAQAYEKIILHRNLPLSTIYFCGGGAKNLAILAALTQRLPEIKISTLSQIGLDGQLIEAQAFAFYGFLSLLGQPLGGSWTGAGSFGPPGHIVPGKNWMKLAAKLNEIS